MKEMMGGVSYYAEDGIVQHPQLGEQMSAGRHILLPHDPHQQTGSAWSPFSVALGALGFTVTTSRHLLT